MFNLLKIIPIVTFLRQKSSIFRTINNEVQMFCPYCNDETRKPNPPHGHLYLSVFMPVFHCFRCNASGILLRLLEDLGFQDKEVIDYLKTLTKFKTVKSFNPISRKINKDIKDEVISRNTNFMDKNLEDFRIFRNYLKSRIGDANFFKFLIIPEKIKKLTCATFLNTDGEKIVSRFINNKYRYKNYESSRGLYHFQKIDPELYNSFVIAEGPFDIINLYLYSDRFKDSIFIGITGSGYISATENLILEYLLIGKYKINIVFDRGLNHKFILDRCKFLAKKFNDNILINGYLPRVGKDVGEFPSIIEL